ncbi:jg14973 [Pararge aegeria aegeria]|uniref:Exocyst complex component 7 n=1 Tax=Pararge aegeria aegeria TaxID=348720 RepID=A0A8S4SAI3_9NEOP|nr:jg14973 [Pararge aegeria aegeria]
MPHWCSCSQCVRSLEEWVEGVRSDTAAGAVDGTVHQLAAATLAYCHALAAHIQIIGPALANEASYARAASQITGVQDRNALLLSLYMRKVLAQLNLSLRNKSEQYPDALKAIFLLNNTLYLLQGLQRSGLLDVLMLAEPECEASYRDMIQDYKNAYVQSWNKLLSHLSLDEPLPSKLRDKDRQMLKDKFSVRYLLGTHWCLLVRRIKCSSREKRYPDLMWWAGTKLPGGLWRKKRASGQICKSHSPVFTK